MGEPVIISPRFPSEFLKHTERLESDVKPSLEAYSHLRITDSTPIDDPLPILKIADAIICTPQNLTGIAGASKSGKTAFLSMCIAAAIGESGQVEGMPEIIVHPNTGGRAVLHFDTEQAKHRQQHNLRAILKRSKLESTPNNYLSYNIRELKLSDYQQITNGICQAAKEEFGGIHIMFIDGLADYVGSVNDEVESNSVVKFFEELAIAFNCPIVLILHQNPGSDKERGHLGSQIQRKVESLLVIKSEGDTSYIEAKLLRNAAKGDIPQLQFAYDKDLGYHVGCGARDQSEKPGKSNRIAQIKSYCDGVFGGQKALKYGDALGEIMRVSGKAEASAKGFFKEMKAHEMIYQGSDQNWRISNAK